MNFFIVSTLLATCLAEFVEISSYSSLDSIDVPLPSVLSDGFGFKSRQPTTQSSYASLIPFPEAGEALSPPPSASLTGASFLHYIPESRFVPSHPSDLVAVRVIEPTDSIFPPALKASPEEVSLLASRDRVSLSKGHESSLSKKSSLVPHDSLFFPSITKTPSAKKSSLSSHDIFIFPPATKSASTKLSATSSYDGFILPPPISSSPKISSLTSQDDFIFPPLTKPTPEPSSPDKSYFSSSSSYDHFSIKPFVPILQDNRLHEDDGSYSFSLQTGDGVKRQEKGIPIHTKKGKSTAITGSYSYILPDGQLFEVHYTADENGFQPQSNYVPIAPAFPHPIPPHAREQIERGRREHLARELRDRQKKKRQHQGVSYAAPSTDIDDLPSDYAIYY